MGFSFHNLQTWLRRNPSSKSSSEPNPNSHPNLRTGQARLPQPQSRLQSIDLDDSDMVIVTSTAHDHSYCSRSDSEDGSTGSEDWSVGWFEPHAPDFSCTDDGTGGECEEDAENSFAVLVPCYGGASKGFDHGLKEQEEKQKKQKKDEESEALTVFDSGSKSQLWAAVLSTIAANPRAGKGKSHEYILIQAYMIASTCMLTQA